MIKPLLPLFASLTLGVVANGAAAQASPAALSLQVYNADAGSFHVNAVLYPARRTQYSSIPGSLRPMRTGSPRWFSTAARR
jgi:hypothetical protein